jgi:hypothetical protein
MHSTPQTLITHWEMTQLLPLIALSQLQPQSQVQSLCLWSNCHETFKRPSDLTGMCNPFTLTCGSTAITKIVARGSHELID